MEFTGDQAVDLVVRLVERREEVRRRTVGDLKGRVNFLTVVRPRIAEGESSVERDVRPVAHHPPVGDIHIAVLDDHIAAPLPPRHVP